MPSPKKKPAAKPKPGPKAKAKPRKKAAAKPKAKAKPRASRKKPPAPPRRPWWRWALRWCLIAALAFFLLTAGWVLLYRFVAPPVTPLMLSRHFGAGAPMQREWVGFKVLPPHVPLAVVASEDQRFAQHHGFDFVEMRKAIEAHQEGARLRGASTLSQQVAKNAFLWTGRSWVRKGLEVYFTALVEVLWGKERILEVYLNIAEFGDGVYGVQAAARAFFAKDAADLSPEEAALLAAVLPAPRRLSPAFPDAKVLRKHEWILQQMENLGGARYLEQLNGPAPTP